MARPPLPNKVDKFMATRQFPRDNSKRPRNDGDQGRGEGDKARGSYRAAGKGPREGGGRSAPYGRREQPTEEAPARRYDLRPSRSEFSSQAAAPTPAQRVGRAPLAANKMIEGVPAAQRAISKVIEAFKNGTSEYGVGAVEAVVTFDEEGKFLGFGGTGAASLRLTLVPADFGGDEDDTTDFGN